MKGEMVSFNFISKEYSIDTLILKPMCDRCKKPVETMKIKNKEDRELLHIEVECHGGIEFIQIPYAKLKNVIKVEPGLAFLQYGEKSCKKKNYLK